MKTTATYSRRRFHVALSDGREFVSNRFGVCWPKSADSPKATADLWAAILAVASDDRNAVGLAIQDAGYRRRWDLADCPFETRCTMQGSAAV